MEGSERPLSGPEQVRALLEGPEDDGPEAMLESILLGTGRAASAEEARRLREAFEAAQDGDVERLRECLAAGVSPDAEPFEDTLLGLAVRNEHVPAARVLLDAGADPNRPSNDNSPLVLAVDNSDAEMVKLLLQAGAATAGDADGALLLATAAFRGSDPLVRALLQGGAPVDGRAFLLLDQPLPTAGATALMAAARCGHAAVVELLLSSGADPNLKDSSGHTALDWARRSTGKKGARTVEILERAGAVPGKTVPEPPVPQDFRAAAKSPGFQECLRRLRQATGAKRQPLEGVDDVIRGGAGFALSEDRARAVVAELHAPMLREGCYVFFSRDLVDGADTCVAALPTSDVYAVIAAVETTGANSGFYTEDLIRWLQALEKEQPFDLTGIGVDFIEGRFTTPVRDPQGLAREMFRICPEGDESDAVAAFTRQLESSGRLFLWWD